MLLTFLTPTAEEPISIGRITVVAGETNAGKTSLLKDVARLLTGGRWPDAGPLPDDDPQSPSARVLENLGYVPELSRERLFTGLTVSERSDLESWDVSGLGPDLRSALHVTVDVHDLRRILHREALNAITTGETVVAELAMLRLAYIEASSPSRRSTRRFRRRCVNGAAI
jgi:hypothetical protein